jgi:hypothetical protein
MPLPIQPSTPPTTVFKNFTRLLEREPGRQQHSIPFKPQRLPEASLESLVGEESDETVSAAKGDDDLMSQDINATGPEAQP